MVSHNISHYVQNIQPTSCCVATAADGNSLSICGQGGLGLLLSDYIHYNCVTVDQLCDLEYTISFHHSSSVLRGTREGN